MGPVAPAEQFPGDTWPKKSPHAVAWDGGAYRVQPCRYSDGPVPDPLANQADAFPRMALVSHLGCHLVPARGLGEHPRFMHAVGQRLLYENVFPALHGCQGDHRVRMVGRGHNHRVDILLPVQHDAEFRIATTVKIHRRKPGALLPLLMNCGSSGSI